MMAHRANIKNKRGTYRDVTDIKSIRHYKFMPFSKIWQYEQITRKGKKIYVIWVSILANFSSADERNSIFSNYRFFFNKNCQD